MKLLLKSMPPADSLRAWPMVDKRADQEQAVIDFAALLLVAVVFGGLYFWVMR